MRFRDLLFLAFRAKIGNPFEYLMEVSAIAIGVALFASSLSLIQLYTHDIEQAAKDLRFRTIVVSGLAGDRASGDVPFRIAASEATSDLKLPLALLDQVKEECPAVQYAYAEEYWGYGVGTASGEGGATAVTVVSVRKITRDYFSANGLETQAGSLLSDADYASGSSVAVLGSEYAKRRFPRTSAVGQTEGLELSSWRILGVLAPKNELFVNSKTGGSINASIFVPLDPKGSTRWLQLTVKDPSLLEAATFQVQSFFDIAYGKERVEVTSNRNWLQNEQRMAVPLFTSLAFISGSILFLIAVNLLSLLMGRISSKARSIGLSAAVGASRKNQFTQHLVEFCLTGLTGGFVGIIAAYGLTMLIQAAINPEGIALPGMRLTLQPATVGVALLLVLGINGVLGLVPAVQASRIRPADAMRQE